MPGQRVALDPAVDVARAHLFGRNRPNATPRGVAVVPVRHLVPSCPGYPERHCAVTGLTARVPSPFTRLPGLTRNSVVPGKSVSARLELCGHRTTTKKQLR